MKISICIPTYNRPDLLLEAINSSLSQTYLPYEILIGDDSRNNDSQNIFVKLQKKENNVKIRYFKNEPSLGQAANVNFLFDKVEGEKLLLLHDDDLLLNDALEELKYHFLNDKKIIAVFGKQYIINEDGSIDYSHSELNNKIYYRTDHYAKEALTSFEAGLVQQFPNNCYLIDTSVAKKIRYKTKKEIGHGGDFDFGFRLGLSGHKLLYINQFVSKYRMTSSSVARNGTDSGYQAFKIILNTSIPYEEKYKLIIDETLKRKAPVAIIQAVNFGKRKEAIKIYFSQWHRNKILTLGGFKRLFLILFSFKWK